MELIISGRHIEMDDSIRVFAADRMERITKEYPKLTTARIVVDSERGWRLAEIHVNGKHLELVAHAKSRDTRVSLDTAIERLEKQLRRHLERKQDHHVDKDREIPATEEEEEAL